MPQCTEQFENSNGTRGSSFDFALLILLIAGCFWLKYIDSLFVIWQSCTAIFLVQETETRVSFLLRVELEYTYMLADAVN